MAAIGRRPGAGFNGETMTTQTLHFRVSGEFVTNIARNLWAEGEEDKALRLLVTGITNMSEGLALEILSGHQRLIGWDSNISLQPDDSKTDNRGLPLPQSFEDVLAGKKKRLAELKKEADDAIRTAIDAAGPVPWARATPVPAAVVVDAAPQLVTADVELKAVSGWLSPDGVLYGCRYTEHVALADALGKTEAALETEGWWKLQSGNWRRADTRSFEPTWTQRQLDTVWDWLRKRGLPMPESLKNVEVR